MRLNLWPFWRTGHVEQPDYRRRAGLTTVAWGGGYTLLPGVSARLFPGKIFEKCFEKNFRPVFQGKKFPERTGKNLPAFYVNFFYWGGLRLKFFLEKNLPAFPIASR